MIFHNDSWEENIFELFKHSIIWIGLYIGENELEIEQERELEREQLQELESELEREFVLLVKFEKLLLSTKF